MNLGILTGTALVNGLNPCGIGLLITFIGYLLVFGQGSKDKKWVVKNGFYYVLSVFVTYLILGLFFYSLASYLQRLWLAAIFKYILGGAMLFFGLIQIKDVFWENSPLHLRMSSKNYEWLNRLMLNGGSSVGILVGVLTTIFATPCMLPIYVGTTSYIANSGLPMWQVLGYFLYYNLIFVSPLIFIVVLMAGGKQVVEMKEMEHRYGKIFRLLMGLLLVGMAWFISKG